MPETRHIALDCSHLEKREQLLEEEKSRRAVNFITKKEELTTELTDIEVCCPYMYPFIQWTCLYLE